MGSFPGSAGPYQSRLYFTYAQLHACARTHGTARQEAARGRMAGCFVTAFGLDGLADVLPLAAAMSGACFLGVDPNGERLKSLLRAGQCDFVVNSLDEALRILKNELRQKQPVSVVLKADASAALTEIEERGVSPDFIVKIGTEPLPEADAFASLKAAVCLPQESPLIEFPEDSAVKASAAAMLVSWSLPEGTASNLGKIDALALPLIPELDGMRRRWLSVAGRYIPRQSPPSRVTAWTRKEFERVVDAFSAQLMAGELQGPLVIETPEETFTLGS
jgi:urocanate hydratase